MNILKQQRGIILTPELRSRILIGKTLLHFGISATLFFLTTLVMLLWQPFNQFIQEYPYFSIMLASGLSIAGLVANIIINFTFVRSTAQQMCIAYWVMSALLIVGVSLSMNVVAAMYAIEADSISAILISFASSTALMLAAGLIVRYTKIDFSKLLMPLFILSSFVWIIMFFSLFTRSGPGSNMFFIWLILILIVGYIFYQMSIIKKHSLYLQSMEITDETLFWESCRKFAYVYAAELFFLFVRLVQLIFRIIISSRDR